MNTKDPDGLSPELAKSIRESNEAYFKAERARDAERLRAYEEECLASWGNGK